MIYENQEKWNPCQRRDPGAAEQYGADQNADDVLTAY
jgi:hypothetical protein